MLTMATREAASASSVFGSGYEASRAVDGSFSTQFVSTYVADSWL